MTCDCREQDKILRLPKFITENSASCREYAEIDACIVPQMETLWSLQIVTEGCCCGHGKVKPSVIIGRCMEPERVREILGECDEREWMIYQWRLEAV